MNLTVFALVLSVSIQIGCSTAPKNTKTESTSAAQTTPKTMPSPAPNVAAQASATTDAKKPGDILMCKRTAEERSLEVEGVQPKGCKLWYSKNGRRSDVASSSIGSSHCESVRARIEETLKGAGFQCQK